MRVLDPILARKRDEVAERKRRVSEAELRERIASLPAPRDFAAAIGRGAAPRGGSRVAAICEIKRRSPSGGEIRPGLDPAAIAREYESSGAAALSVLTDRDFFGGTDGDLQSARAAATMPALRKDFTIDPYQIVEARALGADAVLLIVRALRSRQLSDFVVLAESLGLAALVEAHTGDEVDAALDAGATIIGVNNRDLDTLVTRLDTSIELRSKIPAGVIAVAESGIKTPDDVRRLAAVGYDAILVGESLLRAGSIGGALQELMKM
ncbi:MAG: indole-3-glycerol phosphate synthase TrpC [Phycisphaerae bacterium]